MTSKYSLFPDPFLKFYLACWTYLPDNNQIFQTSKVNSLPSNTLQVYFLSWIPCFTRDFTNHPISNRSYIIVLLDFPSASSWTTPLHFYPVTECYFFFTECYWFHPFNTSQMCSLHFVVTTTVLLHTTEITCLKYSQIVSNFPVFKNLSTGFLFVQWN